MTRRDFQLIADVLADAESSYPEGSPEARAIEKLGHSFARELVRTNPRFDSGRFLRAAEGYNVRAVPMK